jgi:radical SAM-linked protein
MRLRITFSKQGALRYTGQLDLHRIWERTARRAGLPLAYSQGFHPQPKIQLAAALPLGFSSRCEVVDLKFATQVPLEGLAERLQASVPSGLKILTIQQVDERAPALQSQIDCAEYEVTLLEQVDVELLMANLAALLEAGSLPRERRGRRYDLRPLIEQLFFAPHLSAGEGVGGATAVLRMRLACREAATGRPDEVLDELGIPLEHARVERVALVMKNHLAA